MEAFNYVARPADVRFGRGGAADNLRQCMEDRGSQRILLVSSPSQSDAANRITSQIRSRIAGSFTGVVEHVPVETATAAQLAAENVSADLILSIGGGSATGTAKAIALKTGLPIIAVPTTLAGSEMTDVWGITTGGRKETGTHPSVLPAAVVYDSELLSSLPHALAVSSGFNALAHCVEAFWGPRANPLTSHIAAEGIRRLADGMRLLDDDPREALDRLQYGSFLAGTVFAAAGSGLHHKICHALGGAFDLPHAGTHTVVLPHVLRFNAAAAPTAAESIAVALRAEDAVEGLGELVLATGAPRRLRDLGLRREDLPHAVEVVAEKLPIANPREVTREDIRRLLDAAFDEGDTRQ